MDKGGTVRRRHAFSSVDSSLAFAAQHALNVSFLRFGGGARAAPASAAPDARKPAFDAPAECWWLKQAPSPAPAAGDAETSSSKQGESCAAAPGDERRAESPFGGRKVPPNWGAIVLQSSIAGKERGRPPRVRLDLTPDPFYGARACRCTP